MENKEYYTLEEIEDEFVGKPGTQQRDEYEAEIKSFLIGDAIKKAREEKHLTQAQLGEMIGVQRAQISKIESGKNLTLSTIARVFRAMGIDANLDLGKLGRVALW